MTFLSSRILLHTNRGFSAPGASLRGRHRKTRGRGGKRGEGLPRLSNVMTFRGFATKVPKAIGLTKLKGRPFFPFSSPLFVYTVYSVTRRFLLRFSPHYLPFSSCTKEPDSSLVERKFLRGGVIRNFALYIYILFCQSTMPT